MLTVVKSDMFDKDGSPEAWCERVLAECQERLAPLFEHDSGENLGDPLSLGAQSCATYSGALKVRQPGRLKRQAPYQ
ncbi:MULTISPECIES: hypothetical protein [Hyphomicrobiales]|uniref:Uncharacterized protein n=1 Tax=Ancylobacter dichloromethanicus TaxID=518825 RepID=A0A9W6J7N5_9HYPH|nr:hypothetical protein [Methylorubrum extorquens]GLK72331.1 hypothetical protein GCM10017643_24470 [Ancylobacter dichloromethanicus]